MLTLCLNAPYGAWCFLTMTFSCEQDTCSGLNAPYGAWYYLTPCSLSWLTGGSPSLNAPFGARCFLTYLLAAEVPSPGGGLNAPYGAQCFLTAEADPGPHA